MRVQTCIFVHPRIVRLSYLRKQRRIDDSEYDQRLITNAHIRLRVRIRSSAVLKEWLLKTEAWAADSVFRRHLSGPVEARCTDEVVPIGLKRSPCGITWE